MKAMKKSMKKAVDEEAPAMKAGANGFSGPEEFVGVRSGSSVAFLWSALEYLWKFLAFQAMKSMKAMKAWVPLL